RALRVFHGNREPYLLADEVLGHANPVLARESESDVIPWVDRRRPGIVDFAEVVAGSDAFLAFGQQAPHLAAEEAPAIVKFGLAPGLAESESVTVGLGGGGGNAGRQKVARYIARKFHILRAALNK